MTDKTLTYDGMSLHSGDFFSLSDISANNFSIEDIAYGLSGVCRFNGHVKNYMHYSVAQHSVIVSQNVPREFALAALMHDSSEAFICDVPSPLKRRLSQYSDIEGSVTDAIFAKYGIGIAANHSEIVTSDMRALVTEVRDVLSEGQKKYFDKYGNFEPFRDTIEPISRREAAYMFMKRFQEITGAI